MTTMWTDTAAGPASYPTGGFVITTGLSTVAAFSVEVSAATATPKFLTTLDSPAAGQVTVRCLIQTYQRASVGAVSGLPAGVTAPSSSGSQVAVETAHSHAIDHDHAISAASALAAGGSGQVTQAVTSGAITQLHTHTVNLANLAGTSGTQTHQHTWNNIYQHNHSVTNTTTDSTLPELANGTSLATVTLNYMAVDS